MPQARVGGSISLRTVVKTFEIASPIPTSTVCCGYVPTNASLKAVYGRTDQGSVTFNIYQQAGVGQLSSGTAILTQPGITAEAATQNAYTLVGDGAITGDSCLFFLASATNGGPTSILVTVIYTEPVYSAV